MIRELIEERLTPGAGRRGARPLRAEPRRVRARLLPAGQRPAEPVGRPRLESAVSVLDPLTDEQREIRELVRTLARERIAPRAAEIDATAEFPWDVVELFRENDLFGIMFDEEYGGIGASALMTLVAIEELSKVCATSGLILAVAGARLARDQARRQRGAEAAVPAEARERRVARRVCADRAGQRLGLGGDAHRPRGATATSTC